MTNVLGVLLTLVQQMQKLYHQLPNQKTQVACLQIPQLFTAQFILLTYLRSERDLLKYLKGDRGHT